MNNKLLMQLAATAELCGSPLSQAAIEVLAEDLAGEPVGAIYAALSACRMNHRGRLTAEAIMSRLPDAHLPADEAWSIAVEAMDESETVVWTQEIAEAWGCAKLIMLDGDAVGARMAFRAAYERRVAVARANGLRPKWYPSLGYDPQKRVDALAAAADQLRLPHLAQQARIEAPQVFELAELAAAVRSTMLAEAPRPDGEAPLDEIVAALPADREARRRAMAAMRPSMERRVRHVLGEAEKKRQLAAVHETISTVEQVPAT